MKINEVKRIAKAKGVYDKINWESVKYVSVKIPKSVLKAMEENEMVLIGLGEVKSFHNPLAAMIHIDDYLAQQKDVVIPKRK